jgi:hypothetical protein
LEWLDHQQGRTMSDKPRLTRTAETLEAAFGGRWGIWLSDTGRWWASHRGALTAAELAAGCVPFVRADTSSQLAERIQAQEDLLARSGSRRRA